MNHITTSLGERITRSTFDARIRKAKQQKIDNHLEKHGYICCQVCFRNDCKPVDCSHDISVKECIESGRPELAYDLSNITLRGRDCHQSFDGLDLKFSKT